MLTTPTSAPDRPPARRSRRSIVVLAPIAGVLGVLLAAGAVQLGRPLAAPSVRGVLPVSYTVPGGAPALPWPAVGQASVEVLGLGSLGSSGPGTPVPMASIAKIMTAYVILDDHPLAPGAQGPALTITAADVDDYLADARANNSSVRVAVGEKLTEREALEALLVKSADNVARLLATWDAGSQPAFLAKMNAAAAGLGMRDTRYTDPSGLDPATVSTAADQLVLAERALAVPTLVEIAALTEVTLPVAGTVTNYNSLLGTAGVFGLKTGSTVAAGGCLVFAARRTVGGHPYTIVGVVLGQGRDGPFVDVLPKVMAASRKLIDAAGAALRPYQIIHSGQRVAWLHGPLGTGTPILAATDVSVVGWPGLRYRLGVHVSAPRRAAAGAVLGRVEVTGGGDPAVTPAVTQDRFGPPGLWKRLTRR